MWTFLKAFAKVVVFVGKAIARAAAWMAAHPALAVVIGFAAGQVVGALRRARWAGSSVLADLLEGLGYTIFVTAVAFAVAKKVIAKALDLFGWLEGKSYLPILWRPYYQWFQVIWL